MVEDDLRTTPADPMPSLEAVRKALAVAEGKALPRLYSLLANYDASDELETHLEVAEA